MSIPLPSPFTLFFLCILSFSSEEVVKLIVVITLGAAVIIGVPYTVLTSSYENTRSRIYSHYKWAINDTERYLPAVKEREGDHDSVWASGYSLSIDRYDLFKLCANNLIPTRDGSCLASACLALDALDHNWPWKTAEVRKEVSQADKCAAIMRGHSSVSFSPALRSRRI